jgi:hypothetical protein
MNKVKNGNSIQTIMWGNKHPICTKECALKIVPHILCPKMWACIGYIWVKGKHICTTLLVVKSFIWGTIEILDFL